MSDTDTPDPPVRPAIPVDAYIEKYIALRDRKAAVVAAHKKEVAELDTVLDKVELFLLKTMQDQGLESLSSKAGTAYKSTRTSATVADWDMILDFVRRGEHWSALDKRVNKTFVEAWRTEHNDLPPGVSWREDTTVNIRRT